MLALTGTVTTAVLAGCGGPGEEPEDGAEEGETPGEGVGNETAENETAEDNATVDNETTNETGNETGGNETDESVDAEAWADVEEIVLDGETAAWIGVEPEPIADEENPTLGLTEGQEYDITWENVDGQPHNIQLLDENEEVLEGTDIIEEQGETQTLTFEATAEMVEYICEVHPTTMVGAVEILSE